MSQNRQVNHIEHHKAAPSKTLMRRGVTLPDNSNDPRIKAHHAFKHQGTTTLEPNRHSRVNTERMSRASAVNKSDYINHFSQPLGSSFRPTLKQPIKSVLHKPEIKNDLSIDQLLMQAVDRASDQLVNLEQQPVKRFHRFSRALVANRFNGVALD